MEIKLDEKMLQAEINRITNEKMLQMVDSYEIKRSIEKAISSSVESILVNASAECEKLIDIEPLAKTLAMEISRNAIASTVVIMKEHFFQAIMRTKGLSTYDKSYEQERARLEKSYEDELEKRRRS